MTTTTTAPARTAPATPTALDRARQDVARMTQRIAIARAAAGGPQAEYAVERRDDTTGRWTVVDQGRRGIARADQNTLDALVDTLAAQHNHLDEPVRVTATVARQVMNPDGEIFGDTTSLIAYCTVPPLSTRTAA